eukprot:scaffold2655_cov400-Prasinococcus_capsulatus_cf.AAC.3
MPPSAGRGLWGGTAPPGSGAGGGNRRAPARSRLSRRSRSRILGSYLVVVAHGLARLSTPLSVARARASYRLSRVSAAIVTHSLLGRAPSLYP